MFVFSLSKRHKNRHNIAENFPLRIRRTRDFIRLQEVFVWTRLEDGDSKAVLKKKKGKQSVLIVNTP